MATALLAIGASARPDDGVLFRSLVRPSEFAAHTGRHRRFGITDADFSDGGEVALLMASLESGRALSVVTWGAAGQVIAPADGQLDAIENVVDHPIEPLKDLAVYLADAYGAGNARAMASSWGHALRAIAGSGGDISLSRYGYQMPVSAPDGDRRSSLPTEPRPEDGRRHAASFREVPGAAHDIHRPHARWLTSTIATWLGGH